MKRNTLKRRQFGGKTQWVKIHSPQIHQVEGAKLSRMISIFSCFLRVDNKTKNKTDRREDKKNMLFIMMFIHEILENQDSRLVSTIDRRFK